MPSPNRGETHDDFISRCMGDEESRRDFPDDAQRRAFCESQWERRRGAVDLSIRVPNFPRLEDYVGVWAIESTAFHAYWQMALATNLMEHVRVSPVLKQEAPDMVMGRNGQSVSIIKVAGTLMKQRPSLGGTSTIDLRRQIRQAANDPNVSGILLNIDSPGGTVAGTSDLAAEVKSARRRKPVWAHVDDMAASAAYWIAAQADVIYANSPTALIGSIGTLMTVYDVSKAAENGGIKAMTFTTGALKGAGIPGTSVTEEQAAYFQGIVNSSQESFDAAVKSGRGLSAAQLADVRSGAIYPASQAKDKRLIDGIRGLDSTVQALAAAK